MMRRFRFGEAAVYIATTAIVAALVHLIVVLIVPSVATRDAFARLAPLGGLDETPALPGASPTDRTAPYAAPPPAPCA